MGVLVSRSSQGSGNSASSRPLTVLALALDVNLFGRTDEGKPFKP